MITGPTGSGKTTILDAISLALYGNTARLDSINQSSNEVMTRGTSCCSADVVFEASGTRYQAHWYQNRAHNNISGNLQPVDRRINRLNPEEAICSGIRDCDQKIIEITGLTFEQFSQSVMLSQGQFTQFLRSNPNDRADLLEKMTGTQIYTSISQMVYTKYKEKENQLNILTTESNTLKKLILQDDKRQQHEQWLQTATQNIKMTSEQIEELNKQKKMAR